MSDEADDRDDLLEYLAEHRQGCITHGRFDEADMYRDYHAALAGMIDELKSHRATMKRLEEWAEWLERSGRGSFNWPIAAELRNRIKGA